MWRLSKSNRGATILFIDAFTASTWPGYTQDVSSFLLLLWNLVQRLAGVSLGYRQRLREFKYSNAEWGPSCDRTVKLEGYYFVFVLALGLVFLTMR